MMRQDYLIERKLNTKPTTSEEKLIFLFPESRKQLVDTIFGTFFAVALPKESGDEAHNAKSLIAFISYRLNDDENCIRDFKFILALNKDDNEIFVDFCKKNALRYRTAWREFRWVEDDADYDTVLPVLKKFVGNQSNQHKKTVTSIICSSMLLGSFNARLFSVSSHTSENSLCRSSHWRRFLFLRSICRNSKNNCSDTSSSWCSPCPSLKLIKYLIPLSVDSSRSVYALALYAIPFSSCQK